MVKQLYPNNFFLREKRDGIYFSFSHSMLPMSNHGIKHPHSFLSFCNFCQMKITHSICATGIREGLTREPNNFLFPFPSNLLQQPPKFLFIGGLSPAHFYLYSTTGLIVLTDHVTAQLETFDHPSWPLFYPQSKVS